KPDREKNTVALPELRKGKIGLVVATQIARYVEPDSELPGYNSPEIAWGITQAQLAWYRAMEDAGEMVQVTNRDQLSNHVDLWLKENHAPVIPNERSEVRDLAADAAKPIGYILSLEGADSLVNLDYLQKAYGYGLRACGPAHYGPGRYAPGTGMSGGLTSKGRELVKEMDKLRMILDVTHLTDEGFSEALSIFKGPVWASHHNCRSLVNYQRQLTDDQVKILIERGAVIGGVLDTWMLVPGWKTGVDTSEARDVTLERLIDNYDHICQLAGNTDHIAIGSDLDGAYGKEQSPRDIDTIADLQKLQGMLAARGYSHEDIEKVFYKNWLRFLQKNL
ncbi:MAG: membrane dipeptidase, partial [Chitinophagaceae bacterium]|nr:membrane dipeptidase [Chitinophagaceae bacterium]